MDYEEAIAVIKKDPKYNKTVIETLENLLKERNLYWEALLKSYEVAAKGDK